MGMIIKRIKKIIRIIVDWLGLPLTALCGLWLKQIRRLGIVNLPLSKKMLIKIGVFPIIDHYYEPLFKHKNLKYGCHKDRYLPGIDLNVDGQLDLLGSFDYSEELLEIPLTGSEKTEFYFDNETFGIGDSQFLYSVIRKYKPNRVVEIGSGNSTLMTLKAVSKNKSEVSDYSCSMTCIEPYQRPWLTELDVEVVRTPVEYTDISIFENLEENDILFIDSSHMIRPQGDVLHEFLEILPSLKKGVIVHVHDIFTPRDYIEEWLIDDIKFWNEQYLLEAFISCNQSFKVIGALSFLYHNHNKSLIEAFPMFKEWPSTNPGCSSFWMVRQ